MRRFLASVYVCFARPARTATTTAAAGDSGAAAAEGSAAAAGATGDWDRGVDDNPFNLRRFTAKQAVVSQDALREIRAGQKTSHWSWYCIPTPPFIINGVERGTLE
jgi:hypothetical protein